MPAVAVDIRHGIADGRRKKCSVENNSLRPPLSGRNQNRFDNASRHRQWIETILSLYLTYIYWRWCKAW